VIFSWDKQPSTGHPGEAHRCRCYTIPYKGPYIKTTVGDKKIWIPLKSNPELKRYFNEKI
jgi:hypothetical protein